MVLRKHSGTTIIVDCKTRQIVEKYDCNIINCCFVSESTVAYTRDITVEIWNFRMNECKILGLHDNKIVHINLLADNLLVSCDSELVAKVWNVQLFRMLYCSKKIHSDNSNYHVVRFLTYKFLDRMMECKED